MWQSRVEIEQYSVPYLIGHSISITGGGNARCVNSWILDTFTQCIWAPPITEVLRFECGNAIEIRNEIKFNFYSGLPHLCLIYVCMYFTGEFSDIKSLENLRNFMSSASMPRTVIAPRTTAIWKFLQNIQDYALCHSYSPPLRPFLSLSCFSPLPLLSSSSLPSSLPSPLSPSSLPSALPFIFSILRQNGDLVTTHKLATYQSPFSRFSLTNQREKRHMLTRNKFKKIVPSEPKLPKGSTRLMVAWRRPHSHKKTLHACSISVFCLKLTVVQTSWALATRHHSLLHIGS